MPHILLGVTGSVAAIRTPALVDALLRRGLETRVVATEPALYFFDRTPEALQGSLYRDRDEWPGQRYERDGPVLHIELRNWADLLIVAPLDANTLGKLALGLCDNLLTSLLRAWDFGRPVVLAPAMNTVMWESPVTLRHWRQILEDRGDGRPIGNLDLESLPSIFERHAPRLTIVPPLTKRLACGDVGVGAMADVEALVEAVQRGLARISHW
jgi:phosphopantothenoylcysteine decarboxylase